MATCFVVELIKEFLVDIDIMGYVCLEHRLLVKLPPTVLLLGKYEELVCNINKTKLTENVPPIRGYLRRKSRNVLKRENMMQHHELE